MARAIGVDLGTTRSVAATIQAGRPMVIPNAEGQKVTPSVVAFDPDGTVLVGQEAKRRTWANPERTVASVKRYMGSERRFLIGSREFAPHEISALILRKLKKDAEAYLGEEVDRVVISVPAYFNDRQRQATKEAGKLAGLEVMRLINEPTAAALAYGLTREDVQTILVWDLGGGTFDISILDLGEGIFEVRAVSGDNWLGGEDFDRRLMEHLAREYSRSWGSDFPKDPRGWERLREAAENAKIQLSVLPQVTVRVPTIEDEPELRHLEATLTQEEMESLVADLLERLVPPVRQALADAELTPQGIDRVLLSGNGTRMPAVRRLAKQMLGQEPYRYIDPDLVVAMGAAIQAGILLGQIEKIALLDVLPLSLGVETQGGLMARIIPRNTPLPASGSRLFIAAADHQTSMDIHALQGERELAIDNVSLGRCQLEGIPSAPRGVAKVEVVFQADVDGIIHISATELLTDSQVNVKLASTRTFDQLEIEQQLREADDKAEEDREKVEGVKASIEAENLIAAAQSALKEPEARVADLDVIHLVEAIALVQGAVARGAPEGIRRQCSELRLVMALHMAGLEEKTTDDK